MPNGKISDDLQRIKVQKNYIDKNVVSTEHEDSLANAVLEVAYQLAMMRGDIADLMDAEENRYRSRK